MSDNVPVIAIDGPSGSGKGTLASALAERLGWHLLDSGALYRIVAAVAIARGITLDHESELAAMAEGLDISFKEQKVIVDGEDLTDLIRTEGATSLSSEVAALAGVRAAILTMQREMRRVPGLVADGRDMGTVVFPSAELKIFLDADAETRAQRRYNQLKNKGLSVNLPALLDAIKKRDERDIRRAVSPLKAAGDAIIIDSTAMTIVEVVAEVYAEVVARRLAEGT
ncbi:MAG: (d)CMP kinase [Gammaproteobacteria bacterium]|nr:(d)CMP kinase [Gammaproteobacteria bacterium]